ncbi:MULTISPECIES: FMN-dependent NADH-azoreductase [unclassified Streptomyces]|uniref:FMN-dependent NADH-azoreductase n=1 Tax=unclassified Streptomyces TaxID=2593676 RepID=UPI002DD81C8E|nr:MULTISPECIES: NAD(P)H-dependent oxidoreductase [unclassified Streptomyces]WSF85637.1 NAD(P)H-dependent oxidoreductase [Streptomyces sp. NBC_01744]WSC38075.1 NAD(P)H-dependent oxidoreductase [Streptomyces sp. NBC_01763]WSC46199.1 NAD(P)H-dependent oxidoreductase [Streptomyces sp. NBC_01762]WSC54801.1 NAD(P)H-dependent oxidoreductase [Streptomyces sp. NBC_01761]WSD25853.1 NAD(P)H-dependent oxidoreductase [Streptomyces sp. NBC_01751]
MATLLHLDSAVFPQGSASREVTATFVQTWLEQHPDGQVVYRDLAANPLPHLDAAAAAAGAGDPLRSELAAELAAADAVLIGAPMYNFSIPSTLKAWLDQVIIVGHNAGPDSPVAGTPVTVVASRGGSYAPGTPRADSEFVQNYLEKLLTSMFGAEVDFIVPELTLAHSQPAMAELIPLAEASRAKAFTDAAEKAKALASRLAA